MQNTIIGVYDDLSDAQAAMDELLAAGFSRTDVQLNPHADSTGVQRTSSTDATNDDSGSGIGHFFRSLFGMDDDDSYRSDHDMYSEAVRRGSSVLTVTAEREEERDKVIAIMQRHNPVDLDHRSEHWRSEGWSGYDEAAPRYTEAQINDERSRYASATPPATTGATTEGGQTQRMPVVEEQMKVGKRMVQHGGVRVFQRTSEKPVHESVDLRKEKVKVDRKRVDRPASEADLAAFKEGSVEMREQSEEAVVSKEARVVEEVEISKQVTHEQANIDDTVRRTDVEVQQLGTGDARGAIGSTDTDTRLDDSDFRTHWQSAYGRSGGRYEDYDAAYRYGSTMAGSERYRNYRWEDAEPQMRSDWEASNPNSSWEKVKDAVRYGAEKVGARGTGR